MFNFFYHRDWCIISKIPIQFLKELYSLYDSSLHMLFFKRSRVLVKDQRNHLSFSLSLWFFLMKLKRIYVYIFEYLGLVGSSQRFHRSPLQVRSLSRRSQIFLMVIFSPKPFLVRFDMDKFKFVQPINSIEKSL